MLFIMNVTNNTVFSALNGGYSLNIIIYCKLTTNYILKHLPCSTKLYLAILPFTTKIQQHNYILIFGILTFILLKPQTSGKACLRNLLYLLLFGWVGGSLYPGKIGWLFMNAQSCQKSQMLWKKNA